MSEVAARFSRSPDQEGAIAKVIESVEKKAMRQMIVGRSAAWDGRGVTDIRDRISAKSRSCRARTGRRCSPAGSARRGDDDARHVVGRAEDDALIGESYRKFMLHYNSRRTAATR